MEISETNNKTESPANKDSSNDTVEHASSKQKKKRKRRRKNKQTDASAASADVDEKEEAAKEEQEQEREGEEEEQEIESALPVDDDSDIAEDQKKPATKFNHAVLHPTPTVTEWKRKFGRLKSWAEYQLHPLLMQSLKEAKFFSPTPI